MDKLTLGGAKRHTSPGYFGSSESNESRGHLADMVRFVLAFTLFAACAVAQEQAQSQDTHLHEAGSAAVLVHSTFAHGYRHGYEEGYHVGNNDINMGHMPRNRMGELRGVKTGYSPEFGSHRVFDIGFRAGLKAGYSDGYLGRTFRAVDNLRAVAASLDASPSPADPHHTYFDQGFFSGYNDGFERGGSDHSSTAQIDFDLVGCSQLRQTPKGEFPAQGSYCEGYRRGFALGHADGFVLRPDAARLEASK
jgi:hypothetical protein